MWIVGVSPFAKRQNNTWTTVKQWKMNVGSSSACGCVLSFVSSVWRTIIPVNMRQRGWVGGWGGCWGGEYNWIKKNVYIKNKTRAVCLQIWVLALGVWFVFFVSLALFPQIQSDVKRLHFPIAGEALQQQLIFMMIIIIAHALFMAQHLMRAQAASQSLLMPAAVSYTHLTLPTKVNV